MGAGWGPKKWAGLLQICILCSFGTQQKNNVSTSGNAVPERTATAIHQKRNKTKPIPSGMKPLETAIPAGQ
jgi:hypothetical protein